MAMDDEMAMVVGCCQNDLEEEEEEEDSTAIISEQGEEEEEEDPFIRFIEYAKSELSSTDDEEEEEEESNGASGGSSWSWIASRILKTCIAYSSGVTSAILLSDLSQAWSDQQRVGGAWRRKKKKMPECIINTLLLNNNNNNNNNNNKSQKLLLPNTVTVDSIYQKNFLSLTSVLQVVILNSFPLPGTNINMLTLGDFWSSNTIDLYLHRRYYNLVDTNNGILKKGREILLTGCYLRPATRGSASPRLLPTEYLVILLDEDQDDDAMLLGAQFCEDNFSSMSLDAVNQGTSYSLYARIKGIGSLETQGQNGNMQRRQISLVDNDGVRLQFVLWGEQVILANLFSVGSMLALDRPFVAASVNSYADTGEGICLEYGSATQLYLVPFIQHEEQVSVALTQSRCQGSKLMRALDPSQTFKVSQVTLPCDSQGSIDFSNYLFRTFVTDLRDKMTGVTLYGVVTDISYESNAVDNLFSLKIEDATGSIWAKLHFINSWSLGRLGLGHNVYICGLTCSLTREGLGVSWFEKDVGVGTSFVNLSCLPALLNSDCLHKMSHLSHLSSQSTSSTRICRIWLDQIEHCHVNTRPCHALCGHFASKAPSGVVKCNFCHCDCDTAEIVCSFHLRISIADNTAKVSAWCAGQTATELLQISPDDFCGLPEEEQIMYPSSLENEKFIVALVNSKSQGYGVNDILAEEHGGATWEITRAIKSE